MSHSYRLTTVGQCGSEGRVSRQSGLRRRRKEAITNGVRIADIHMVAIDSGSTVVATDNCVTTTIDGEIVLLNNETGRYQGLSGAGPDIWDRIQEPTVPTEIVSALVEEYDVDRDRAANDVDRFLETLAAEQLIKVDASPTP